jgi:hypothetical protein
VRAVSRVLVVLAVLAASVTASRGAEPSFSGRTFPWPGMENLLKNARVAKEIKLTPAQELTARRALFEPLGQLTQDLNKLQGLKKDEYEVKSAEARGRYNEAERATVGKILRPAQFKRIKQIQVQAAGNDAFLEPVIQKELKLSAEQKDKVKAIAKEFVKAKQEAQKGSSAAEIKKKEADLSDDAKKKLLDVLTDDQKKTWKEMNGDAFDTEGIE